MSIELSWLQFNFCPHQGEREARIYPSSPHFTFSICTALVFVRADVSATFSLTVAAQATFFHEFRNDRFR